VVKWCAFVRDASSDPPCLGRVEDNTEAEVPKLEAVPCVQEMTEKMNYDGMAGYYRGGGGRYRAPAGRMTSTAAHHSWTRQVLVIIVDALII
jgi:hypothetical protein